jgi:hypothetical protein
MPSTPTPSALELAGQIIATGLRIVRAINHKPTEADTALFAIYMIQRGIEKNLEDNYNSSTEKKDFSFQQSLEHIRAIADGLRKTERTKQHDLILQRMARDAKLTDQELAIAKKLLFAD